MKKILLTSSIAILGTLAVAMPAWAATTATLAPATISVVAGQQFNVAITVDPQGTKEYAEKVEVDYPADELTATSFTLGNGAMALTQAGYDTTDNINGVLMKTAGYTGGISSPTLFGTILFTAKKAGSGTITVGNQSAAFTASGQGTISGVSSVFTVSKATVPVAREAVAPVSMAPVASVDGLVVTPSPTPTPTPPITAGQQAAAVTLSNAGSDTIWYWIGGIVVIALIVWFVMRKKRE